MSLYFYYNNFYVVFSFLCTVYFSKSVVLYVAYFIIRLVTSLKICIWIWFSFHKYLLQILGYIVTTILKLKQKYWQKEITYMYCYIQQMHVAYLKNVINRVKYLVIKTIEEVIVSWERKRYACAGRNYHCNLAISLPTFCPSKEEQVSRSQQFFFSSLPSRISLQGRRNFPLFPSLFSHALHFPSLANFLSKQPTYCITSWAYHIGAITLESDKFLGIVSSLKAGLGCW